MGSVCAELPAQAVQDGVFVSIAPEKLVDLKRRIRRQTPGARISIATKMDEAIGDCDLNPGRDLALRAAHHQPEVARARIRAPRARRHRANPLDNLLRDDLEEPVGVLPDAGGRLKEGP